MPLTTIKGKYEFHFEVAERRTRPQKSWDEMHRNVAGGRAELIAGYLDSHLVAATFINRSKTAAQYSTGVYDRGRFDKPLAHWPVYLAISRARESGCRYFDLGEVFLGPDRSEKEVNIGFFKKGFTDRIEIDAFWRIRKGATA